MSRPTTTRRQLVKVCSLAGLLPITVLGCKQTGTVSDTPRPDPRPVPGGALPAPAGPSPQGDVRFEWVIPFDQANLHRDDLDKRGAKLEANRDFIPSADEKDTYAHSAFGPLVVIAGVVAAAYLVDKVIGWVRSRQNHGLIIDARSGGLSIKEHPSLDRGTVLVMSASGAQRFDSNQQESIRGAIDAALGARR